MAGQPNFGPESGGKFEQAYGDAGQQQFDGAQFDHGSQSNQFNPAQVVDFVPQTQNFYPPQQQEDGGVG